MSLNFTQIVALIDRTVKTNSVSYPIEDKTADINLALDFVLATIFKASGTWQFDDSNQTNYPIISTNLVAGQRDYNFVSDQTGNLILDIYKVVVAQPDGTFIEIFPVDVQTETDMNSFFDGLNLQGTPNRYDKTANAIFLDLIPNYSIANGLKIYINREASYFTTTDTIKKAGFAGLFHEYLAMRPAWQYATRNSLPIAGGTMRNGARTGLLGQLGDMETAIGDYYGIREKDKGNGRLRANIEDNR